MTTRLNPEELFHLAVTASDRGDTATAIDRLKQAVEARPAFADAHYLLGAEHAQLGMFDCAIADMQTALAHRPDLHAARFQLGLLWLTSGQVSQAQSVWDLLEALGPQHPLVLFRNGLLLLVRDEFSACADALRAGIAANHENTALNIDMRRILDSLPGHGEAEQGGSGAEGHFLVGAYGGLKPH